MFARLDGFVFGKEREVPTEFRIFASGANPSEKGTFTFSEKSALSVMAEFAQHAKPMLLDYNHGTTIEGALPEQAISAGEFTPEIRNGELWATNVRWTDRAKAMLSAGEYRLFSPYFTHDKTGQVIRLVNVALTNLPALDGIAPLVAANANTQDEEPEMETCTACAALSAQLSAMKTECDALKTKCAAFEKKGDDDDAETTKATALRMDVAKLTGQSDAPGAIGVISAWKASHDKVAALTAELDGIKATALAAEFTSTLDKAVSDKLITKHQRETFWETQCKGADGKVTASGLSMLSAFVKTAKPVVGGEMPAGGGASPAAALPPSQLVMAANLSVDPAKFAAYKAEQAARAAH